MNENVFPFKSSPSNKKKERILIVRLSDGSEVLEAASMEIDDKTESLSAKRLKTLTTPFPHDSDLGVDEKRAEAFGVPPGKRFHRRNRRRTNWVRLLNIAFIVFVTLTAVIPAFLSSAVGIAIFASSTNAPDAKIYKGDLMISKIVPASDLGSNDVLLLHNDYTWDLEIRRVINDSPIGDLVKITTSDGIDQNSTDAYTVKKSTSMHKVIRIVPKFGYWLKILTSVPAKILGGLFVIAINVAFQIRRTRRLRNGI